MSNYFKEYYQENKEKIKERTYRNNFKKRYGISIEERDQLLDEQDHRCAICSSDIEGKNAHVDHCHTTGEVRGMLCFNCNGGLGNFKDNRELLMKAIKYLE